MKFPCLVTMLALACGAVEKTAAEEVESVYRTNRRGGISHREENPYEISHEVKKEESMNHRLILIATLIVLAAVAMLTQKHVAHSAASTVPLPAAPAEFSVRPIKHSIS